MPKGFKKEESEEPIVKQEEVRPKVFYFRANEDKTLILRSTGFLKVSDGYGGTKIVADKEKPPIKIYFRNKIFALTEPFAKEQGSTVEEIKEMIVKHPQFGTLINWYKGEVSDKNEPKPGDFQVRTGPR